MKKLIAGIVAVLCVFGSFGYAPAGTVSPASGTAITADAADAEIVLPGKNAGSYKYAYADTSLYTTKFTKTTLKATNEAGKTVDISTWTGSDGNTYAIYAVEVSETASKTKILTENVIALVTAKETNLDVVISQDLEIPDNVKEALEANSIELSGTGVGYIADSAFAASYLKTIDLSGVKYIGNKVFSKCAYITDIEIPASVRYVGTNVFDGSGLKTLSVKNEMPIIPANLCSSTKLTKIEFAYPQYIRKIDKAAFMNTPVNAPLFMTAFGSDVSGYESLDVGESAYENCTSIKSVEMPDNVSSIGIKAFKGCTSLGSLTCGKKLLGMDQYSFDGCSALDTINFNSKLICIGGGSFRNCTSLKEVKNIPTSIEDWLITDPKTKKGIGFGDGVFAGCTALELCELPSSLTKIPDTTFSGCSKLTTVVGDFNNNGDNFTFIGKSAFAKCTSLTEAKYTNVDTIDDSAFSGCTKLTVADFPAAVYIGGEISSDSPTIDTESKTVKGKGASFSGCTALTKVNIPSSKYILQSTFKNCSAMTQFTAGECEVVGNNALDGCSAMEEITLLSNRYGNAEPTSKNTTDGFVFQKCSGAKKITIKSGYMTKTPNGLFNGCSSLEVIDGDLTNIAIVSPKTFADCSALKEIDLPAVRILETSAFSGCSSIKKISNSSSALNAEDYGDNSFLNCTELNIVIEGTISTIGASAFKNSGITKVNIEGMQGGTVVIGNNAFSDCQNLTEAKILSDSAAKFSIGTSIFSNCPILRTATYDGKIITSNMFKNCPKLETISTNGKNIKTSAFEGDSSLIFVEDMASPGNTIIADEINASAFKGCASLKVIPADSHTNMIGNAIFANCESIRSVDVGVLTQSIFSGCTSLNDVTLTNITSVPASAFAGCTALESFDFSGIANIGTSAFSASGLTKLTLNDVQTIDASAFASCSQLESIDISADTVGKSAFGKCTSLKEAKIDTNNILTSAFSGCTALENVDLTTSGDHSLAEIGASAFTDCSSLNVLVIEGSPKMGSKSAGYIGSKVNTKMTLVGNTGSTVQDYADTNKIAFVDVSIYDPSKPPTSSTTTTTATKPVSSTTTTTTAKTSVTLLGDANNDKKVSVADAVAILQSLANRDKYALTPQGAANADCFDPGDGITGKDALAIQKLDAKAIDSLPERSK